MCSTRKHSSDISTKTAEYPHILISPKYYLLFNLNYKLPQNH